MIIHWDFMAEEVKKSKSWNLDELLAMTRDDSQITVGREWRENPTRFKLKETKYFLDQVCHAYTEYIRKTTDENRDVLLFNLSAFLAAGRSITANYMQSQYDDEWYREQHFEFNQELRFLTEIRNDFVHKKPQTIIANRGLESSVTARVVYADGDPRKKTAPPLPETKPSEPIVSQPVTYEVVIRPDDKLKKKLGLEDEYNILDFCNRQYKMYEKLVKECEKRFASSHKV